MRISAFWPTALFALVLFAAPAAFALTTDHDSGMNGDGSAKFSDPDDQRPGFMHGPSEDGASVNVQPTAPTVSPGMYGLENSRSFNPQNQGPDAFDQAYSRK